MLFNKSYIGNVEIKKAYLGSILLFNKTGVALDSATQAVLDRISFEGFSTYSTTQKTAVNNFIIGLKTTTIWNKAKTLRLKRFNDLTLQNATRVNLKNPTSDLATLHGGFTYTLNGFKYNGVNSYTNEKFNPVTAGLSIGNFVISHQFGDDFTVSGNALCGIGGTVPTRRIAVFPKSGGATGIIGSVVQANDLVTSAQTATAGMRLHTYGRSGNLKTSHINSMYQTFETPALEPLLNYDYYTGALNDRNTAKFFCDGTDSFFYGGEHLTESEANTLRTLLNNFYTETGQTPIAI